MMLIKWLLNFKLLFFIRENIYKCISYLHSEFLNSLLKYLKIIFYVRFILFIKRIFIFLSILLCHQFMFLFSKLHAPSNMH